MTLFKFLSLSLLLVVATFTAKASESEGTQLYRVSTVRAAPGTFPDLLAWATPKNADEFLSPGIPRVITGT